jgi:hypothetical protein
MDLSLAHKVIKLIEFLGDQKLPKEYEGVEQIQIYFLTAYEI